MNAFEPPRPKIDPPAPRSKTPRLFPDKHDLYVVQRHALQVLHGIRELEAALGDNPKAHKLIQRLERDAENTYKVIRSYLDTYVKDSQ